jgi:hypothetical protein
MAEETTYKSIPFIYRDRGLITRDIEDQCPPDTYLNDLNCLSRAENSMSSRYGTIIINRDPAGTGTSNYYFTEPVTSLSRLTFLGSAWRYAGLSDGSLWRRAGNAQGAYTGLTLPTTATGTQIVLSGQPFESIIQSCFETSQAYLFIYDQNASIKDQGTGSPQLTGIDPSPYTLNVNPYAPLLTMIDSFAQTNSYTIVGISPWGWGNINTLTANKGNNIVDFTQFIGVQPLGGGGTRYPTSGSLGSAFANAIQNGIGSSANTSASISGFASIVPASGETVTAFVTIEASTSVSALTSGNAEVNYQYSPDGGVTWNSFYSFNNNSTGVNTLPSTTVSFSVATGNLSLLEFRIYNTALVYSSYVVGAGQVTAAGYITYAYATVSSAGAFGPIQNGMLSVLNSNTQAVVNILSVTSQTVVGGLYTQLLVNTSSAHGLVANNLMAIYASSSDLVDGFYQVISAPTTTSLVVAYQSATQIGATGGYVTYADASGSYAGNPPACVLTNQYTSPYPSQMSAWGFYEWVPPTTANFPIGAWSGTIAAASSTGTVSSATSLDLNQSNQVTDSDLIVLTFLTSDPANIAQVQLQFFVGSGTNNYYTAFISPAYYQQGVDGNQLAYQTTENQILADTLGLISGQTIGTTTAQLQPTSMSTGSDSWKACYIPRGNFLPVGQAGQAGMDWSNVTGWMLTVTTNSNGGASFSCNGLYLQWGYGPSSFSGVGYDYRSTYYNSATGTESSPCPEQMFNADFGYLASTSAPIFLCQAAQVVGQYSPDPQVTHVRQYRRGGTLSSNWVQVGQIPNVTGTGQFVFKDVIADAYIQQAQILVLDNDPPVTRSLVTPIQTTLASSTIVSGLSSIYSTFTPQLVQIVGLYTIVQNQLVIVGNPSNEEVVAVVGGGSTSGGNTTFSAILRLQHNQGEPVSVYAVPRQPCSLCAEAYGQVWLAGDVNNPNNLYYSKKGLPENFGPQNYIPVSTPDDIINAVINWRGTLIVGTLKTWKIIVGGAQPYPQTTGSVHGIVARNGWIEVEGAVYYRAADGWREFTGADGVYKTLPIEWIFRGNPQCIPPQADPTQAGQDVFAYYNNQIFGSYVSLNAGSPRYRMSYDTQYQRFRYDDVAATAMLWERDTNVFLVGKQIGAGKYAVVQDQVGDYDDGGWNTASPPTLIQTPINLIIQSPYRDLGKPHNKKQWNCYEVDVNTQGQVMTSMLLFEDGFISVPLANASTTHRDKVNLFVNNGLGQEAYRASIVHTIPVTVAPILYQEDIYAAELAELTATVDSYWIKFGTDESKFAKQAYFDYSSPAPIAVSLYADNNAIPYFTFTLPAAVTRTVIRQRFGNNNPGTTAFTFRTWRLVALATGAVPPDRFQMWAPIKIEWKPVGAGNNFRPYELQT